MPAAQAVANGGGEREISHRRPLRARERKQEAAGGGTACAADPRKLALAVLRWRHHDRNTVLVLARLHTHEVRAGSIGFGAGDDVLDEREAGAGVEGGEAVRLLIPQLLRDLMARRPQRLPALLQPLGLGAVQRLERFWPLTQHLVRDSDAREECSFSLGPRGVAQP